MTDTTHPFAVTAQETTRPKRPPRHTWPLMGDIVSARGGWPEHLIQWRRAMDADDPAPSVPVGEDQSRS